MLDGRFVAIAGTKHYWGTDALRPGQWVRLVKEPDNKHDDESIRVELAVDSIKLGYVANSAHTVPRGCQSAGRIYESFDQQIYACIRFILKDTAIAELMDGVTVVMLVMKKGAVMEDTADTSATAGSLFFD